MCSDTMFLASVWPALFSTDRMASSSVPDADVWLQRVAPARQFSSQTGTRYSANWQRGWRLCTDAAHAIQCRGESRRLPGHSHSRLVQGGIDYSQSCGESMSSSPSHGHSTGGLGAPATAQNGLVLPLSFFSEARSEDWAEEYQKRRKKVGPRLRPRTCIPVRPVFGGFWPHYCATVC